MRVAKGRFFFLSNDYGSWHRIMKKLEKLSCRKIILIKSDFLDVTAFRARCMEDLLVTLSDKLKNPGAYYNSLLKWEQACFRQAPMLGEAEIIGCVLEANPWKLLRPVCVEHLNRRRSCWTPRQRGAARYRPGTQFSTFLQACIADVHATRWPRSQ